LVPMNEELSCEQSGIYKLWISNEHAWIHSLRVKYKILLE
uniref:GOLD domain-containing protein n=1 Tax=Anisakis simplex TaxID=6269 RepID=A0A0M3K0P9_ANISI